MLTHDEYKYPTHIILTRKHLTDDKFKVSYVYYGNAFQEMRISREISPMYAGIDKIINFFEQMKSIAQGKLTCAERILP